MENGIAKRQMEEKYIEYLAAQRQLYKEAKRLDCCKVLCSVVLPLVFAVMQILFQEDSVFNSLSYAMSIFSMLIGLKIDSDLSEKKETAAEIQQHFDIYVYDMPWDSRLFGEKNNVSHIVAEKSKPLLRLPHERDLLKNWYNPDAGSVPLNAGILICQKINYQWDINLRKRFKVISRIIIYLLVGCILLMGILKEEYLSELLWRAAFILPLMQWLLETIKQLNSDIRNINELGSLINSEVEHDMPQLQLIQSKIYNHRKSCFILPEWIYRVCKKNDEDTVRRTTILNR